MVYDGFLPDMTAASEDEYRGDDADGWATTLDCAGRLRHELADLPWPSCVLETQNNILGHGDPGGAALRIDHSASR
jgi:hypothetical protein